MKEKNIFPALAIILASIAIFSVGCSKTGPTGATGPQGLQGTAGPTGPQGPQGNANVHVDTFTVSNAQWLWNDNYILYTSTGSYTEWFTRYYKAAVSQVTQGILDSGMVLVYMTPNTGDQDQWSPLPYMFDTGLGYAYEFVYVTSPGGVELEFFFAEEASNATPPTLSSYALPKYKFKVVAVTGTLVAEMQNAQIETTNYGSVAKYLGL